MDPNQLVIAVLPNLDPKCIIYSKDFGFNTNEFFDSFEEFKDQYDLYLITPSWIEKLENQKNHKFNEKFSTDFPNYRIQFLPKDYPDYIFRFQTVAKDRNLNLNQWNVAINQRSNVKFTDILNAFSKTFFIDAKDLNFEIENITLDNSIISQKEILINQEAKLTFEIADREFRKSKQRIEVLKEIRDSEDHYVRDLQLMTENFNEQLFLANHIDIDVYRRTFKSVKEILPLHRDFFQSLQTIGSALETSIGPLFLEYTPFFKVAVPHVANYSSVIQEITDLIKLNKSFSKAVYQICQNVFDGNTVESLLVTPVQRIPRYPLLLRELIKCTPDCHWDKDDIQLALEKITKLNQEIDLKTNEQKAATAMAQLQKELDHSYNVLASGRVLVSRLENGEDTLFLFNDLLLIRTKTEDSYNFKEYALLTTRVSKAKDYTFRSKTGIYNCPITDTSHKFLDSFSEIKRKFLLKKCTFDGSLRWEKSTAEGPSELQSAGIVSIASDLYLFGGKKEDGKASNELWWFHDKKWELIQVKNPPPPRYDFSMSVFGAYIVVFGGRNEKDEIFGDLLLFDIPTATWMTIESYSEDCKPSPRFGHAAAFLGTQLWIYGGKIHKDYFDDFYCYDFDTNYWWRIDTSHGPEPRAWASALWIPERFINKKRTKSTDNDLDNEEEDVDIGVAYFAIFGGVFKSATYNSIWIFDYDSVDWIKIETIGDFPTTRFSQVTAVFNNSLYVIGGKNQNVGLTLDSYRLDLTKRPFSWAVLPQSDEPDAFDSGGAGCVIDTYGLAIFCKKLYFIKLQQKYEEKSEDSQKRPIEIRSKFDGTRLSRPIYNVKAGMVSTTIDNPKSNFDFAFHFTEDRIEKIAKIDPENGSNRKWIEDEVMLMKNAAPVDESFYYKKPKLQPELPPNSLVSMSSQPIPDSKNKDAKWNSIFKTRPQPKSNDRRKTQGIDLNQDEQSKSPPLGMKRSDSMSNCSNRKNDANQNEPPHSLGHQRIASMIIPNSDLPSKLLDNENLKSGNTSPRSEKEKPENEKEIKEEKKDNKVDKKEVPSEVTPNTKNETTSNSQNDKKSKETPKIRPSVSQNSSLKITHEKSAGIKPSASTETIPKTPIQAKNQPKSNQSTGNKIQNNTNKQATPGKPQTTPNNKPAVATNKSQPATASKSQPTPASKTANNQTAPTNKPQTTPVTKTQGQNINKSNSTATNKAQTTPSNKSQSTVVNKAPTATATNKAQQPATSKPQGQATANNKQPVKGSAGNKVTGQAATSNNASTVGNNKSQTTPANKQSDSAANKTPTTTNQTQNPSTVNKLQSQASNSVKSQVAPSQTPAKIPAKQQTPATANKPRTSTADKPPEQASNKANQAGTTNKPQTAANKQPAQTATKKPQPSTTSKPQEKVSAPNAHPASATNKPQAQITANKSQGQVTANKSQSQISTVNKQKAQAPAPNKEQTASAAKSQVPATANKAQASSESAKKPSTQNSTVNKSQGQASTANKQSTQASTTNKQVPQATAVTNKVQSTDASKSQGQPSNPSKQPSTANTATANKQQSNTEMKAQVSTASKSGNKQPAGAKPQSQNKERTPSQTSSVTATTQSTTKTPSTKQPAPSQSQANQASNKPTTTAVNTKPVQNNNSKQQPASKSQQQTTAPKQSATVTKQANPSTTTNATTKQQGQPTTKQTTTTKPTTVNPSRSSTSIKLKAESKEQTATNRPSTVSNTTQQVTNKSQPNGTSSTNKEQTTTGNKASTMNKTQANVNKSQPPNSTSVKSQNNQTTEPPATKKVPVKTTGNNKQPTTKPTPQSAVNKSTTKAQPQPNTTKKQENHSESDGTTTKQNKPQANTTVKQQLHAVTNKPLSQTPSAQETTVGGNKTQTVHKQPTTTKSSQPSKQTTVIKPTTKIEQKDDKPNNEKVVANKSTNQGNKTVNQVKKTETTKPNEAQPKQHTSKPAPNNSAQNKRASMSKLNPKQVALLHQEIDHLAAKQSQNKKPPQAKQ